MTYNVNGFVDKNRDVQQDVFFDFLSRSKVDFVQELTAFQARINFKNHYLFKDLFCFLR